MKKQIPRRQRRVAGFTLLEIMVVVVIIGLLAAIIAPSVIGRLDDAAITRAKADIRTIESAINQFRIDNFRYPTEEEGIEILLGEEKGVSDKPIRSYLPRLPIDPWEREYLYAQPGQQRADFDVYTFGADGEEGGDGVNADIGNWDLN